MSKDVVIRNVDYDGVPYVKIPLQSGQGNAEFYDTSGCTLDSGNKMLDGYTAIANGTTYTGSITTKTSSDLSASGATVTVPSGYYASQATKSVDSGSVTAPASISGTSASVSTGTNTLTLSKTVSVQPNVTSAGYISSGTSGNSAVSLTASVTTKAAATITPGTSDVEIAAGTYLTGKQTIKGDSNLKSSNIVSGVSIFSVQGSASVPIISQDQNGVLSIS